jgi:hypothetical protein
MMHELAPAQHRRLPQRPEDPAPLGNLKSPLRKALENRRCVTGNPRPIRLVGGIDRFARLGEHRLNF